jgi:nitroimidazol reductase NimA-like FMN-containing flavoprotein (pyridoxamine 5'-phosphate oxidase superfamily)
MQKQEKHCAMDREQLAAQLRCLFQQQLHMVLATHDGTTPYTSLMAFTASAELDRLFLATSRATHKYSNMAANNQVSALIDNRTNRSADFQSALAVTALGQAKELLGKDRKGPLALFLHRHPELEPFCLAASSTLMAIMVRRYILVNRFDEVHLLDIETIA